MVCLYLNVILPFKFKVNFLKLVSLDQPEVIVPEVEEAKITTFICEAHFGGPRKDLISPDQFPQVKMSLNRGGLLRTTVQEFEPNHNITYYTIKQVWQKYLLVLNCIMNS